MNHQTMHESYKEKVLEINKGTLAGVACPAAYWVGPSYPCAMTVRTVQFT